ncbi:site-specific DNA-methyltransferase [Paenalcaligenes hominis]|uniref:site-specific DNA-methyltransferase n=1 Tax=Paenalcaligenes hominis TaxID=643674 RepID=UPI0035235074
MSSIQQEKAKQRRAKFAALLRNMFQLDEPELDFGLYRIMHAKKDDINRFIDEDLPKLAQDAFKDFVGQDKSQLEKAIQEARQAAVAAGFDPDESPKVKELEAQYNAGFETAREEGEVYDALVTFFSRYYDEGDFISRRVYKDGTYAIPYQGEEVVLHWANKDQYYVKSSETLRDYTLLLNPRATEGEDRLRVHFKVVDASEGAKDNNKETDDSKRQFVLDAEQPFEFIQGEPDAQGNRFEELVCRFEFRPATMDDWESSIKAKATAAAQKNIPTQAHLLDIAEVRLLGESSELPDPWKAALQKPYIKADGEATNYSTLKGQLNNYTKKNTFDYFIHKDLGGFLNRELDFYIKNELMQWEDIAALKNNPARLVPMLSKLDVIRELGGKIIAFLAQLENFQKKLWLKKKFVTETNYCITLDRVPQELYPAICANPVQHDEWVKLFSIDEIEGDLTTPAYSNPLTEDFLKSNQNLVLDTRFFDESFKAALIASIEDFDEQCDGLLVHSENYQALNLLRERYKEQVKYIYIDPPYNTESDRSQGKFIYKDGYARSSWLSLMNDRIGQGNKFLREDGVLIASIDDNENYRQTELLESHFGKENYIYETIWNLGTGTQAGHFTRSHEYIQVYAKNKRKFPHFHSTMTGNIRHGALKKISRANPASKVLFPAGIQYEGDNAIFTGEIGGSEKQIIHGEMIFVNGKLAKDVVVEAGWAMRNQLESWLEGKETFDTKGQKVIRFYFNQKGILWYEKERGTEHPATVISNIANTKDGSSELEDILSFLPFPFPKPSKLLVFLGKLVLSKTDLVFDYFAGSGTTGHAVINLNREDNGKRKYILVEMGSYFDTVLKPRLAKVAYSSEWKNGKPVSRDTGISHCFKYIRLESYEDTLGNLRLNTKQDLFSQASNDDARQAYVMNYMLDVETRGSQSLLNINQFLDPTQYQLNVRSASGDETVPVNVDLLETFNYLLGLEVEHIAAPIYFDAEFSQGEYGRMQAKVSQNKEGQWWFRTVYGKNRNGQYVLVVWRNLPSVIAARGNAEAREQALLKDNAVLDAVLVERLKIRLTESLDDEIDVLYVNGDHNISIPRDRQGRPLEQARVQLIEEAFKALMFADTDVAH